MRKIDFTVECDELTVKEYLKKHLQISARSIIELKNTENGITLNGNHVKVIEKLHRGDVLSVLVSEPVFIDEKDIPFKILFQNENYIVFDKPINTTVYKSGKEENNINDTVINKYPSFVPRPFYRLDKNTSGTLLFAKNSLVMQGTNVNKTYFAICHGKVDQKGVISEPIALQEGSVIKRCCREGGQEALTEFERIYFDGENSLLKIKIHTGRTHQIRVHFSHIGHPLLGDDLYNGERDLISRQALHCGICNISNSAIKFNETVASEFPSDFASAIKTKAAVKIGSFL